jgi:hypothetical protein
MMMRRRRGVGIVGVAAVAGVAHHAGTKSAQASANEQAQNQQLADLQAQNDALAAQQQQAAAAPAPVAAAPAAPAQDDMMVQLKQFADLHAAGVLTDEEFAAAKAKVLAGG